MMLFNHKITSCLLFEHNSISDKINDSEIVFKNRIQRDLQTSDKCYLSHIRIFLQENVFVITYEYSYVM